MRTAAVISTLLILLFISPAALAADAKAAPGGDADLVARALAGQEQIFARDYPAAKAIFDALTKDYPNSPAGPFGNMAILEMRMLEREDFHLQSKFLKVSREGLKRVNGVMQLYSPSTWELFLAGSLLGLDGFYKARKGAWWDAYTQGGKSRQIFRRVKKMDPGFIDADFGLGMYLYWRSVFTRDIWFLKMFPDKRAEGIAIVEKVARKGHFAKDLAKINLAIMYFEEKRFPKANRILSDFVSRYPNNVIIRRLYGKLLISLKRYDDAVSQFKKVLTIVPEQKKPHYFIGAALVIQGDPAKLRPSSRSSSRCRGATTGLLTPTTGWGAWRSNAGTRPPPRRSSRKR